MEVGSRRYSEGVAAAAASASCSAARVYEEAEGEAEAGEMEARAAETVEVAVTEVARAAACELNVCPTGGRQVFLLSVRLNGRPLLDS